MHHHATLSAKSIRGPISVVSRRTLRGVRTLIAPQHRLVRRMRRSTPSMAVLLLLMLTQPGCVLLDRFLERDESYWIDPSPLKQAGYSIPDGGLPTTVPQEKSDAMAVILEVRTGETPHLEKIPLPKDRPVFVQDIVQQAKLHEQIGRLKISIMRPLGAGQPPLRMDLRTDKKGVATSPGTNYALLPGDHLVVVKDDSGGLGELILKQLTGFSFE